MSATAVHSNPAIDAFAAHCFSPFLTAETAAKKMSVPGVRVDFYDLVPFSNVAPSPGEDVAPGTDRRCEVAFDGSEAGAAAQAVVDTLASEGILTDAPLPDSYTPIEGTELLAARFLNPKRIAVVHVGTRPGPNGVETFMLVERQNKLD